MKTLQLFLLLILSCLTNTLLFGQTFLPSSGFTEPLQSGQRLGLSFEEAIKQGLDISHLDTIYPSAVHVDTAIAVFKTEEEQKLMYSEYVKLLQNFGNFLSENNFFWKEPTRCFNRIFFNYDGTIEYLIYNFIDENSISEEKEIEFKRLLNLFIKDYKILMTATTKFAQCSPITYKPK
jgi:hypothetical protein